VVVASDAGWGMERSSQLLAQVGRFVETEIAITDYLALARAFGWAGWSVSDADALRQALEEAKASETPSLIEARIDPQANLAPPGALIFASMVYRAED
jgi:acetolactate synthase-1/2/3 large subunit